MTSQDPSKTDVNAVIDLFSKNKFKEALNSLKKIEEKFPSEPLLHNIKGACLEGMNLFDEAISSYEEAISIDPLYAKAHYNLGGIFHEIDRLEDSVTCYRNSLNIDSSFAEAQNNLGNVLREMDQQDDAINCFIEAIKLKPDYVESLFSLSMIYQNMGQSDQVVDCLKKVIKIKPNFANAYNNLGVAFKELNQLDDAVEAYKSAINIHPDFADAQNNLGNAYKELGNFDDAIKCYEIAINTDSNYPAYFNNLGILLTELKQFERANLVFQSSLAINPEHPDTHNSLGNSFKERGDLENAMGCYQDALAIDPNYSEALNNLGNVEKELGQIDKAINSYETAIELNPTFPEPYNNLGIILKDLRKFDEAINNYKRAITLNPKYVEGFNNLGIVYFEKGQLEDAFRSYQKALTINPDFEGTLNNLGIIYFHKNDSDNAIKSYRKAIHLNPSFVEAYDNLGTCLKSSGELNEALDSYKKAISINPNLDLLLGNALNTMMNLCIWDELKDQIENIKNKIDYGKLVIGPFEFLALADEPRLLRKITEVFAQKKYPRSEILPKITTYPIHKKIRIGYFSPDFREHPVSDLIVELLEIHNRDEFEIHAFSCGQDTQDKMNLRIKDAVDHFHDVYLKPDEEISMLARSLKIDIAIDLGGFTQGSRVGVFAMSAAPIQICYLGYPGTMSADYMDYLICDRVVIPEDKQNYYLENLVYMPNSYMVNDSQIKPSDKSFSKNDLNLPAKGFVFCCFNNAYKITPETFLGWMRILKEVSDSVLWLSKSNKTTIQNLKQEAVKHGIDENRLIFASRLELKEDHLKRIQSADLFIDTLPFNAHTTSSDALRVGLPVLTRIGESFTSRVAASLLNAVNLPELITTSQEDYETLAIELATNPKKYRAIKEKLINNLPEAPLYDTPLFTRQIESAYKKIYERHHDGLEPTNIYV